MGGYLAKDAAAEERVSRPTDSPPLLSVKFADKRRLCTAKNPPFRPSRRSGQPHPRTGSILPAEIVQSLHRHLKLYLPGYRCVHEWFWQLQARGGVILCKHTGSASFFSPRNKQAAPAGAFAGLRKKQSDIPQPSDHLREVMLSQAAAKWQPPTQAACTHAALRGDLTGFSLSRRPGV